MYYIKILSHNFFTYLLQTYDYLMIKFIKFVSLIGNQILVLRIISHELFLQKVRMIAIMQL